MKPVTGVKFFFSFNFVPYFIRMKILDRYILKAHVAPFVVAFLTIVFVLILQFLTVFLNRFLGKGLELLTIAELILLQSAWMVGLAVPMAVLAATLITFGNLTNRSEIVVMRAGGLSIYRLIAPVLAAAMLVSIGVERFNNVVLPEANFQAKLLLRDISRAKPSVGLKENAFSRFIDGYSILVRQIDDKTGELRGITIYEGTKDDYTSVITAESGMIEFTEDYHYLIMTLHNGEIHEMDTSTREEYRLMSFSRHRFVFSSTGYGFERSDGQQLRRGDRELSAVQLKEIGDRFLVKIDSTRQVAVAELQAQMEHIAGSGRPLAAGEAASLPRRVPDRTAALEYVDLQLEQLDGYLDRLEGERKVYVNYMLEYHRKYALSFACIVFALVGAPLGVLARRGGFGIGAGLSLAFFVMYWSFLMLGEQLAGRSLVDPAIAMWMGNIVMMAIGIVAMLRVTGTVGGGHR